MKYKRRRPRMHDLQVSDDPNLGQPFLDGYDCGNQLCSKSRGLQDLRTCRHVPNGMPLEPDGQALRNRVTVPKVARRFSNDKTDSHCASRTILNYITLIT